MCSKKMLEVVQDAFLGLFKQETPGHTQNVLQRLYCISMPALQCCWTLQLICRQVSVQDSVPLEADFTNFNSITAHYVTMETKETIVR